MGPIIKLRTRPGAGCRPAARTLITCTLIAAIILALFLALERPISARAGAPLSFVDQGSLAISVSADQDAVVAVPVVNDGPAIRDLRFTVILAPDQDGKVGNTVEVMATPNGIAAHSVVVFQITLRPKRPLVIAGDTLSGWLEVSAPDITPATRPLTLRPDTTLATYKDTAVLSTLADAIAGHTPLRSPATTIVVLSGLAALLFLLVFWVETGNRLTHIGSTYKRLLCLSMTWSFGSSWAVTLTSVGAILGTVAAAGVIPSQPTHMPQAAYIGLNVVFGAIATLAPFLYQAHTPSGQDIPDGAGYTTSFILAAGLTLWAVLGELLTLFLLSFELVPTNALTQATLVVVDVLVVVGLVAIAVYVWSTMAAILRVYAKTTSDAHHEAMAEAEKQKEAADLLKHMLDEIQGDLGGLTPLMNTIPSAQRTAIVESIQSLQGKTTGAAEQADKVASSAELAAGHLEYLRDLAGQRRATPTRPWL